MRRILPNTLVLCSLFLGGCVVAWGGSYQIESQTPDAITIQYDTNFIDEPEIQKMAIEHCQKAGKVARLQSHDRNIMNISTEAFTCQSESPGVK